MGFARPLGATPTALVRTIVTQAFRGTAIGARIGIFGAAWITPVVRTQLME